MNIALSISELVSVVMEFSERMSMLVSIVDRVSLGGHPSPKGRGPKSNYIDPDKVTFLFFFTWPSCGPEILLIIIKY